MTPRLAEPHKAAPDGIKAMMAVEASIGASGLEHGLLDLVKLRASQINGCAYCIHMHATDARGSMARPRCGSTCSTPGGNRRSTARASGRRSAWTEALTRVAKTGAPDEDYALVKAAFTESEQVNLTLADRRHQSLEPAAGRLPGGASGGRARVIAA